MLSLDTDPLNRDAQIEALQADLDAERAKARLLALELEQARLALKTLNQARERERGRHGLIEGRLAALEASTIWRGTHPLRVIVETSARFLGPAKGWVRLLYWLVTPGRMQSRYQTIQALNRRNGEGFLPNLRRCLFGITLLGSEAPQSFDAAYRLWVEHYDCLSDDDRTAIAAHLRTLEYRPKISIVVPVYNTALPVLREALMSVVGQCYTNWELCIADDCSTDPGVAELLRSFAASDSRIKCTFRPENGHIAKASNTALDLATGEFVAFLDHDDVLAEHALYETVVELNAHPDADILYSDEDKIDENGVRFDPYFKPDFSLDLLLGQNVVNHLCVVRKSIVDAVGGFRPGFEGSQDYDLVLRAVARTRNAKIRHIAAILYHWRQAKSGGSFSQEYLDQCVQAGQRAVADFLDTSPDQPAALVRQVSDELKWNRISRTERRPVPSVSIIIPTRDRAALLSQCVEGLLHRTDYDDFEIIVVDNDSAEPETLRLFDDLRNDRRVRIVHVGGAFNFSALNNAAAAVAQGEILLLLNNDIDVMAPRWLSEMVGVLNQPDVGVVGAKLLYADDRVQHAGVRLGAGTFDGGPGIAGHLGLFRDRDDPGYFGMLALTRDVGAVTGACLAVRRSLYMKVGGLDERHLPVAFNDVDLCLKIREEGKRIVWTPFAELHHLESASRGSDLAPENLQRFHQECRFMRERWGEALQNDPFYNPAFDNFESDFKLAFPPRRRKPWQNRTRSSRRAG